MKNLSKAVWGGFFVLLGIVLAGRALNLYELNLYFNGWWTLFIIIPSLIGLFEKGGQRSSFIGLGIGIFLLLAVRGVINWYDFPKLLIAYIFVTIGLSFMFRQEQKGENGEKVDNLNYNYQEKDIQPNNNKTFNRAYQHYFCLLGSRNVQFIEEVFTGAALTSVLGNIQLDIRNAYMEDDVVIEANCILGGIDIFLPKNVKVVVNCTPVLGGVESHITSSNETAETRTVFIRGNCILGGVDIK